MVWRFCRFFSPCPSCLLIARPLRRTRCSPRVYMHRTHICTARCQQRGQQSCMRYTSPLFWYADPRRSRDDNPWKVESFHFTSRIMDSDAKLSTTNLTPTQAQPTNHQIQSQEDHGPTLKIALGVSLNSQAGNHHHPPVWRVTE